MGALAGDARRGGAARRSRRARRRSSRCRWSTRRAIPSSRSSRSRCPTRFLRETRVLPLREDDTEVALAMADPTDEYTIDAFRMVTGPHGAADGGDSDRPRGRARAPVRHRQVRAEPGHRRRRDARRRPRLRRRRPAAEGPRLRSAGDPAREPPHHQRARHARVRHPRRAVRESSGRALSRRRRAARRRIPAQAPGRRGDLAHQDHGQPRHRRAPPAAGRPHPPARAGQGDRPARVHRADDARRVGGHADPRQGRRRARLPQAGLHGRHAEGVHRRAHAAARHPARHRPDGLGQDDHALHGARSPQPARREDPHRRGPGRVPDGRHQPDPGEAADRPHVRQCAALDPAPGPGRDHDRRDPRPRDRADRGAGGAHRPPRAVDGAHQRRRVDGESPPRHGRGRLPAHVHRGRHPRAAPRAQALPALQGAVQGAARGGRAARPRHASPAPTT